MYLKECLIENVGPIGHFDVSLPFTPDGTPKPIVLVGQNGSGKTILLSHVVDALVELAKIAFTDIVPGQRRYGAPFFKLLGGLNNTIGKEYGIALLDFAASGKTFSYIDKSGNVHPDTMKEKLRGRFSSVSSWLTEPQKIVKPHNKVVLEEFFQKAAVCFFPSSRHERPHWLNREGVEDRPHFSWDEKITGRLNKPIVVESAVQENRQWLLDVVLDPMVDFEAFQMPMVASAGNPHPRGQQVFITSNLNDKVLLKQSRQNVNQLLGHILQDQSAKIVVGYRAVSNRLSISLRNNRVIPSLDHLSAGQAVLFNLFATIIRYADRMDIHKSIRLNEIEGMILVDEIDAHLHTDLQYDLLPKLLRLFPRVQFILTSHAPLFLLGMEKAYGTNGFVILEMPTGRAITTERFSEFVKSFEYFKQTQAFEDELRSALMASQKPVVFTEGETDPVFIRASLELLGRTDLLDLMELRCVGRQTPQGSAGSGVNGLNHTRNVAESHPDLLKRKVLLLYDCDSNKSKEDVGPLSIRAIPKNEGNKKIRKGIENLFPETLFEERFYDRKTDIGDYGEEKIIPRFRKDAFCKWICEERKEAADFTGFNVVIDILDEFLGVTRQRKPHSADEAKALEQPSGVETPANKPTSDPAQENAFGVKEPTSEV